MTWNRINWPFIESSSTPYSYSCSAILIVLSAESHPVTVAPTKSHTRLHPSENCTALGTLIPCTITDLPFYYTRQENLQGEIANLHWRDRVISWTLLTGCDFLDIRNCSKGFVDNRWMYGEFGVMRRWWDGPCVIDASSTHRTTLPEQKIHCISTAWFTRPRLYTRWLLSSQNDHHHHHITTVKGSIRKEGRGKKSVIFLFFCKTKKKILRSAYIYHTDDRLLVIVRDGDNNTRSQIYWSSST